MSKFEKGHIPWIKGKKKKDYPDIIKAPSTAFKKGNVPWTKKNKGYKLSEEAKINISKGKSKYKEGEKVIKRGYVYIKTYRHPYGLSTNYVKEHRLILEKYLDRYLKSTEECHHIDLNKQNNKLSNLILFKTKSAHRRFEFGKSKVLKSEIIFDGRKYKE